MKKSMVIGIVIVGIIIIYSNLLNNYRTDERMYIASAHESSHAIVDEILFPNSVKNIKLKPVLITDVLKYTFQKKSDKYATLPAQTVLSFPEFNDYNKEKSSIKKAATYFAGYEGVYVWARNTDIEISQDDLNEAYEGAKKDRDEAEQCLLEYMKTQNVIPNTISSIEEFTTDEQGDYYLNLFNEAIELSKSILNENVDELNEITGELKVKRKIDGERLRKILNSYSE